MVGLILLMALPAAAATEPEAVPGAARPIAIDETGVHVALELDGVRMTGLALVGALEAKAADEAGACAGAGLCTADLQSALDDLDRTASAVTLKTKHDTAKNAIGNIRGLVADLGNATGDLDGDGYPDGAARTYRPGQPQYGNITLRRAGLPDSGLYAWFKRAAAGENARKSGSILYLDRAGNEVARYNLFDCWPVAWRMETEAGIVEEIEFAVERVERAKARADLTENEEGLPAAARMMTATVSRPAPASAPCAASTAPAQPS